MSKKERERQVLLGLVDYYIKTGKPVGSHTLKGAGFDSLSSATIRNYFANLENAGFLHQHHSSGGRFPTESAFRLYAAHILDDFEAHNCPLPHIPLPLDELPLSSESTRAITSHLQQTADILSAYTSCAAFLSAPRFDHDFVVDLKLLSLDAERCVCVIMTDFGLVQTEVLHTPRKLSTFSAKRIEGYFQARLAGQKSAEILEPEEEAIAQNFYNELMIRHLVSYTNFSSEYLYATGFARLLNNPEFHDVKTLASSLSLFEDRQSLRHLVQHSCRHALLKIWVGSELTTIGCPDVSCSVLAIPYKIHNQIVGAIGLLGHMRLPYREHIATLHHVAQHLSEVLTRTVYKFKISFRQPEHKPVQLGVQEQKLLLEDKSSPKSVKKKHKIKG